MVYVDVPDTLVKGQSKKNFQKILSEVVGSSIVTCAIQGTNDDGSYPIMAQFENAPTLFFTVEVVGNKWKWVDYILPKN